MGTRSAVSQKLAHAADLQVQAMRSAARRVITTLDPPIILQRPLAASSAGWTTELASRMRPINRL